MEKWRQGAESLRRGQLHGNSSCSENELESAGIVCGADNDAGSACENNDEVSAFRALPSLFLAIYENLRESVSSSDGFLSKIGFLVGKNLNFPRRFILPSWEELQVHAVQPRVGRPLALMETEFLDFREHQDRLVGRMLCSETAEVDAPDIDQNEHRPETLFKIEIVDIDSIGFCRACDPQAIEATNLVKSMK
jgi:hypothetical protein